MIDLTQRLEHCRTRTRFQVTRYNWQAGAHTIELVRAGDGQTFQWSANPNHPDSLKGWQRFEAAFEAAKSKLPPVLPGTKRKDVFLDLVTSPASDRRWENFWWTPCGKEAPKSDPPDNISDLFG